MQLKISIFGTGYVGLVSGVGFASLGHEVICVDNDEKKIEKLRQGNPVIYEIGLTELLIKSLNNQKIYFTTDTRKAVVEADILFLALPTPSLETGEADVSKLYEVACTIGKNMQEYKIIVNKSTSPVGTLKGLQKCIHKETKCAFDVVSNPEFLKEGTAINDFLRPDRIIIGAESERAIEHMKALYQPLLRNGHPILIMDPTSAELAKYAANCMLATRIGFMNQMANLCDALGANINWIREALAKDPRIGSKFLYAGIGYGGSCLPKDIRSLIHTGLENHVDISIIEAANKGNNKQWKIFFNKILDHFEGRLTGKKIAVWGLAFKPYTDDTREAPSIPIIQQMLKMGVQVTAHDPVAINNAKKHLSDKVTFAPNAYEAVKDAEALVIVTEWGDYSSPDYSKLNTIMKTPVIFDGRNVLNKKEAMTKKFIYYGVGKGR